MTSRKKPTGKVSEQMGAYKTREPVFSSDADQNTAPSASQLRNLAPRERRRLLALQAKHAAGMFARDKDDIIGDASDLIEY